MDQIEMSEVMAQDVIFWIPEEDNGCRMWKCPKCSKRMVGHPLNFGSRNFNPYKFCPYCGERLYMKGM